MKAEHRKVVVIGAGCVGTAYIYALLHTGIANEVALIDIGKKRVEGEITDRPFKGAEAAGYKNSG